MGTEALLTCWSCRGTGTGTWCQICAAVIAKRDRDALAVPVDPVFGAPQEPGRTGTWMQTYQGLKCWPRSPRPEDIDIADIAVGLARECRYGKMTLRWYSVAEHSVIVSLLAGELARATFPGRQTTEAGTGLIIPFDLAIEREGLFHDSDESPLHDMPRPIKHDPGMNLDGYRACAQAYRDVVYQRFHIRATAETHELIDTIDKRLVIDEIHTFMRKPEMYLERYAHVKPIGCKIAGLEWEPAMELFLSRFAELYPEELT